MDFSLDSDKNEAINTGDIMKNLTPEQLELITQVIFACNMIPTGSCTDSKNYISFKVVQQGDE